jgi:hypothetical protein
MRAAEATDVTATDAMTKIASAEAGFVRNDPGDGPLSMEISEPWPMQMNTLPVDRALSIYGALANRTETKGAREKLSKHLMKKFSEGEKDQHRLTVHGLSYLQNLDRELDSKN